MNFLSYMAAAEVIAILSEKKLNGGMVIKKFLPLVSEIAYLSHEYLCSFAYYIEAT